MKTAVFVASHICYDKQLTFLDKCLNSLEDQTVNTNVHISISFENTE